MYLCSLVSGYLLLGNFWGDIGAVSVLSGVSEYVPGEGGARGSELRSLLSSLRDVLLRLEPSSAARSPAVAWAPEGQGSVVQAGVSVDVAVVGGTQVARATSVSEVDRAATLSRGAMSPSDSGSAPIMVAVMCLLTLGGRRATKGWIGSVCQVLLNVKSMCASRAH